MTDKTTEERIKDMSKAYNPPLLFLAGLLTFCLGVIAAVFSAIDKVGSTYGPLLGPILAWAAVTALVGTIAAGVLQYSRSQTTTNSSPPKMLVCGVIVPPILSGIVLAVACIRLGTAIAGKGGFWSGLTSVFSF